MPEASRWCECCAANQLGSRETEDRAAVPWYVLSVHEGNGLVSLAHTVGLWESYEHPELMIATSASADDTRLDRNEMAIILETCAAWVSAGSALMTGQRWRVELVEEVLVVEALLLELELLARIDPLAPVLPLAVESDVRGLLTRSVR